MEKIREATIEAMNKIEESKEVCAKAVDQVSQTWEALMDDEQSQKIANELTLLEANITQIRNDMKQLPLSQKMAKEIEMRKLLQQITVLCTQQQHREGKVEELLAET